MDAYIFRFSAKQFRSLGPEQVGFLAASGHCCNELAILMPYMAFEQSLEGANDVESALILVRRFTIERIVVSKIVEYHELCQGYLAKLKKSSSPLFDQVSSDYKPISKMIGSAQWAYKLRNKASFHYDQDFALSSLAKLEDEFPLKFLAGKIKGITLFDFSEEVMSRPIYEAAGSGDIGKGMEAARAFVLEAIGAITSFHSKLMIYLARQHGFLAEREKSELRESYCADPRKLKIPLSLSQDAIDGYRNDNEG